MRKANDKNKSGLSMLVGALVLISTAILGLYALHVFAPKQQSVLISVPTVTPVSTEEVKKYVYETDVLLTPTLIPASRDGWVTFVYPDTKKKYTFDYPSTAVLEVFKYRNFVSVSLDRIGGYSGCKIDFAGLANDKPRPGRVVEQKIYYGGRKAGVYVYYKDTVPYAELIVFEGDMYKDPFDYFEAYFPPSNTTQCQRLVDEILSSIKFYY